MNRSRLYLISVISLLTLTLCAAGCRGGQARRLTVKDPDCGRRCPVVFERIATLGANRDTIWPTALSSVVQGRSGQFYLGSTDHPGTLIVYSAHGRFLGTFGRTGQGPGEYRQYLSLVRGPGDTISVVDAMQQRRTLIDSAGVAIRMHRIPPDLHDFAAVGKRVFVQADVRTPTLVGFPVHELAPDGSILRSFAQVAVYRHPELDGVRRISAAGDSGLWVAPRNRYEATYYDTAGKAVKTLRPEVDFFPPDGISGEPAVTDVWQDQGRLWVVIRVPDLEWRPDRPRTEQPITLPSGVMKHDWLLEVVDIGTGERLASLRFDEPVFKGSGDGVLYGETENEAGGVVVFAYRVRYRQEGG
jgi:hypothetical protein